MQLLRCCFYRRNTCRVKDNTIHYVRAISNITTVVFDADDSSHVIMLWFSCDLNVKKRLLIVFQYNYHICFKTC